MHFFACFGEMANTTIQFTLLIQAMEHDYRLHWELALIHTFRNTSTHEVAKVSFVYLFCFQQPTQP